MQTQTTSSDTGGVPLVHTGYEPPAAPAAAPKSNRTFSGIEDAAIAARVALMPVSVFGRSLTSSDASEAVSHIDLALVRSCMVGALACAMGSVADELREIIESDHPHDWTVGRVAYVASLVRQLSWGLARLQDDSIEAREGGAA